MIAIAKGDDRRGDQAAAEYFGSMKWTPWIKVVESRTVPKTRIAGGLFLSLPGDETEPLGKRIIEMPEDNARRSVPRSARRVRRVRAGGQHQERRGARENRRRQDDRVRRVPRRGFEGLGPVPGLAGRSPSYMRATDVRHADGRAQRVVGGLMKPVVAKLTEEDLINIAAYTASLTP